MEKWRMDKKKRQDYLLLQNDQVIEYRHDRLIFVQIVVQHNEG